MWAFEASEPFSGLATTLPQSCDLAEPGSSLVKGPPALPGGTIGEGRAPAGGLTLTSSSFSGEWPASGIPESQSLCILSPR